MSTGSLQYLCYMGNSGRTSTAQLLAAGHLAAQSIAVSKSGTSIIKNPPSCSLVSA
ncbi:MAG: hypothetical protein ACK6CP_01885 [Pseudanabaena sp.]|nr:hypothetical protein [Pseudanabaena sp. 42896M_M3]